mmetsp:Transcript_56846/g.122946  ORF Transcript_56846/g.122946 Transcript_56846/m.122946 type:complete len:554 (-) Transcript_56846:106-1767(-)
MAHFHELADDVLEADHGRSGCEEDPPRRGRSKSCSGRAGSKGMSYASMALGEHAMTCQTSLVTRLIAQELRSPEMLRAINAAAALRGAGWMLRRRPVQNAGARVEDCAECSRSSQIAQDFERSFVVTRIDHFWSHNWGAPVIQKVLVLLLQYNLLAAALVSTAIAALAAFISSTIERHHCHEIASCMHFPWAMLLGQIGFFPVLLLWQSKEKIFLDKACISQMDAMQKKKGIESIGAILGLSRDLLVLWDPGYVKRLWCVFELAAYVKARGQRLDKGAITIRPVSWGPMWMALYIGNSLVAVWYFLTSFGSGKFSPLVGGLFLLCVVLSMHIMRSMQRLLTTLSEQLQAFSFAGAECYCCSVRHVDPVMKQRILCDRKVVLGCIVAWFGSVPDFEDFVHSGLYQHFKRQLGLHGLPYVWVLSACLPYVWMGFDLFNSGYKASQIDLKSGLEASPGLMLSVKMFHDSLAAVTVCGTSAPLFIGLSLLVARLTQRQQTKVIMDVAASLVASVAVVGACLLLLFLSSEMRAQLPSWLASLLKATALLTSTFVTFRA